MSKPKWAGTFATLWTAMQLAACSVPTEPEPIRPEPQDTTPRLEVVAVDPLVPGQTARLQGRLLDQLTGLSIDGQSVTFEVLSPDEVEFSVPTTHSCDVEGRPVKIVANSTSNGSATTEGLVRLEHTLELEVGESRVLSAEELECLQLSGRDEDYVLSVANFSLDQVMDAVFHLQSRTTTQVDGPSPSLSAQPRTPSPLAQGLIPAHTVAEPLVDVSGGHQVLQAEGHGEWLGEPFDDYANAKVGDTLQFVDWQKVGDSSAVRATKKEDVPTYEAVVIALSGNQMIVVDQRSPHAAAFDTPAERAKYQEAAEMVDRYALPAIRAVIDPNFEQPMSIGGRMITIIREQERLGGVMGQETTRGIPWRSDMFVATLSDELTASKVRAELVASTIIHELAHLAEGLPYSRGTGSKSGGWYTEALAESVVDMAARMALGHEEQAPVSRYKDKGVPLSSNAYGPPRIVHKDPLTGPVGERAGITNNAAYVRGARILLFAQEQLDQHRFDSEGPLLHQRLMAKASDVPEGKDLLEHVLSAWSVEAIAREIGMSAEELLERSMMADLTDDLVARSAVEKYNLPQVKSWDRTPRGGYPGGEVRPEFRLSRQNAHRQEVNVPGGGYMYWFIGQGKGRGLSLTASEVDLKPHHQVKITRLR